MLKFWGCWTGKVYLRDLLLPFVQKGVSNQIFACLPRNYFYLKNRKEVIRLFSLLWLHSPLYRQQKKFFGFSHQSSLSCLPGFPDSSLDCLVIVLHLDYFYPCLCPVFLGRPPRLSVQSKIKKQLFRADNNRDVDPFYCFDPFTNAHFRSVLVLSLLEGYRRVDPAGSLAW